VLVTPWCMNLVLLPGQDDNWSGLMPGKTVKAGFPNGDYVFTLSAPDGIDTHLSLPLFTTVQGFADQDTACDIAREVLRRLYRETRETAPADPVAAGLGHSGLQRPLSRRALLRGWLTPEGGA
jgi:[NiFe] hydrogenase assembly HybE family chaperone